MEIVRYAFDLAPGRPPQKALQNEWGLSLHLQSWQAADSKQVLIDFGCTPERLNNNLELLKIDPAQLDALVLSHGHYDHFGGLNGFLAANNGRLKAGLPFYLGGEECYCTPEAVVGGTARDFGYLDRKASPTRG